MRRKASLWKPWIGEARAVINEYARYVFASLILGGLVLLNIALVLAIALIIKEMVHF